MIFPIHCSAVPTEYFVETIDPKISELFLIMNIQTRKSRRQ